MTETVELLSLLYELSLCNLKYRTPADTANAFVKKILSRKSLQYGAVWKTVAIDDTAVKFEGIYSLPEQKNFKSMSTEVFIASFNHDIFYESTKSLFEDVSLEGNFAYFKLNDFGILELYDSRVDRNVLDRASMSPFHDVITQFASSLESGFSHQLLQKEISHRKKAEESLKSNEEKYRRIIDNIQLGLLEVDNNEMIQFANEPFLELTGYKLEEIVDKKASLVLLNPEDEESAAEIGKQNELRKSGDSDSYEVSILDKKGQKKWLIVSGAPNYDETGQLVGSIGIHLDITEEKKLRIENEFKETQLKKLFEMSLDALITINSRGKIIEWSPQAEKIFGFTPDEIMGERLSEKVIPHQHRESHENGMGHYEKTGHGPVLNTRIEIVGLRKNGEVFPIELTVFPLRYHNENYFTAFVRDITELKKSKEDVEKALKRQTELNNLKSQFISMTSHELRTPLTTIRSNTELLNYQLEHFDVLDRSKLEKNLGRIEGNVERLNQLVNNILMIGQLDSKKVPFDPKSTDVCEFIQHYVLPDFTSRDQKINCSKKGTPHEVRIDHRLFSHIMSNLIENAVKYSQGKPDPELLLEFFDDRLELHVIDHGMGIPEAEQKNLFETFFRASNVGNIQGTGLGLSIVNEFVKIHGGRINVESKEGEGTSFIIIFPKKNDN